MLHYYNIIIRVVFHTYTMKRDFSSHRAEKINENYARITGGGGVLAICHGKPTRKLHRQLQPFTRRLRLQKRRIKERSRIIICYNEMETTGRRGGCTIVRLTHCKSDSRRDKETSDVSALKFASQKPSHPVHTSPRRRQGRLVCGLPFIIWGSSRGLRRRRLIQRQLVVIYLFRNRD